MPQSPYQVYSAGQQVNQGPGNRYIPPTYNYRAGTAGSPRNYNEMDWNNVQSYNLPQQQNNPYQQQYMQGLRDTTSRFGQMPMMPQFGGGRNYRMGVEGVYNDIGNSPRMTIGGFPAPQQRGGGMGGVSSPNNRFLPEGYAFEPPSNSNMSYTAVMPRRGYQYAYGPGGERIEVPDGTAGNQQTGRDPYEGYFYNNMLQSQRGPQNIADQYSGDMSQFEGPMYDPGDYSGRRPSFAELFGGGRPSMPNFQGGGLNQNDFNDPYGIHARNGGQNFISGDQFSSIFGGGGMGGPNNQGGMGRWQQMLQDFFSRMGQQQQQGGQQKPGWAGSGDGAVKPGPNAPQATDPYAKIGYRG